MLLAVFVQVMRLSRTCFFTLGVTTLVNCVFQLFFFLVPLRRASSVAPLRSCRSDGKTLLFLSRCLWPRREHVIQSRLGVEVLTEKLRKQVQISENWRMEVDGSNIEQNEVTLSLNS